MAQEKILTTTEGGRRQRKKKIGVKKNTGTYKWQQL